MDDTAFFSSLGEDGEQPSLKRIEGIQASEAMPTGFEACHKVFDVPELAEWIFLQLHPMFDILAAVVHTCKHWKSIVDNSIKLQQLLFLKPISTTKLRYFGDNWVYPVPETGRWATSADDLAIHRLFAHPFLATFGQYYSQEGLNWIAIQRPEASWRHALATQPAVVEVGLDRGRHVCRNDAGVTLEDFVPFGFAGPPFFEGETKFEMEWVEGDQEFESVLVEEPCFADLKDVIVRPYKAEKTPREWGRYQRSTERRGREEESLDSFLGRRRDGTWSVDV